MLAVLAAFLACAGPSKQAYFESRTDGHVYARPLEGILEGSSSLFVEHGLRPSTEKNVVRTRWTPDPQTPGGVVAFQATATPVDVRHTRVQIDRLVSGKNSRPLPPPRREGTRKPEDLMSELAAQEEERFSGTELPAEAAVPRAFRSLQLEWELLQRVEPGAARAIQEEETIQTGCGHVRAPVRPAPPPALVAETRGCEDVPGADELLYSARLVVLGELNGTDQAPAFVGHLVCRALAVGLSVSVALELPRSSATPLEAFLASDGAPDVRDALLASPAFTRTWHDGRDSGAVFALIDRLRVWRRAGAQIDVLAMDDSTQVRDERDRSMAEALEPFRRGRLDRPFIALVGNVHAATDVGMPLAGYIPMGARLQDDGLRPIALRMSHADGAFWGCDLGVGLGCGVHRTRAWPAGPPPAARTATDIGTTAMGMGAAGDPAPRLPPVGRYVRLWGTRQEGFDGLFYVGTVTASPPARP
jgi:hypothetical protein